MPRVSSSSTRRDFLRQTSTLLLLPYARSRELQCDVAVIGGGFGGVAAALGALRNGQRVVLTEETDWIGGQVTSQAVPPDEHAWIESFGCTRAYRSYRDGVREYYRRHYPLTETARATSQFNPGNATVSRIAHEPRVSLAVLESMLAPYVVERPPDAVAASRSCRRRLRRRSSAGRDRATCRRRGGARGARRIFSGCDRARRPVAAHSNRVCDRIRSAGADG